jgi:hypothetical protein
MRIAATTAIVVIAAGVVYAIVDRIAREWQAPENEP